MTEEKVMTQPLHHEVEIDNYLQLKANNNIFESEVFSTQKGHKFILIIRPNGLQYTKGFNNCMGVWLKPVPGEKDSKLSWPAKVKLSLKIKARSAGHDNIGHSIPAENTKSTNILGLSTVKDCEWFRDDTKSVNPVLNFDLLDLKQNAIEQHCLTNGYQSIILIIEEN